MTFIIHGATGAQGSPVLSKLTTAGRAAVAATRQNGIDLSNPQALRAAYDGASGVFVHLPLAPEDVRGTYASNIVAAIAEARPERVVISTSGRILDDGHPLAEPGGSPLRQLIEGVASAGVSSAVVSPRLFLENLLLPPVVEAVRTEGVLRYPLLDGFAVAWASHGDVADAIIALLDSPEISGIVEVGQNPAVTGADLAAAFSERLGTPVVYEPVTPETFGASVAPLLGEGAAAGVTGLYGAIATLDGLGISGVASTERVLGLTPRSPRQWLDEIGF